MCRQIAWLFATAVTVPKLWLDLYTLFRVGVFSTCYLYLHVRDLCLLSARCRLLALLSCRVASPTAWLTERRTQLIVFDNRNYVWPQSPQVEYPAKRHLANRTTTVRLTCMIHLHRNSRQRGWPIGLLSEQFNDYNFPSAHKVWEQSAWWGWKRSLNK